MCFIPVPRTRNLSASAEKPRVGPSAGPTAPGDVSRSPANRSVRVREATTTGNPDGDMEGQVRIITVTAFVAMSVACGGSGLPTTQPSSVNAVDAGRSLVAVEKQASGASSSSGRFKAAPDGTCTFDPNDFGPNQCTPAVVVPGNPPVGGRFKAGPGGTCVFVPNDAGPNQCTP